jgi:hypothetical protein
MSGAVGLYHLITDVLQTSKFGLRSVLNLLANRLLRRELDDPALSWVRREQFAVDGGRVSRKLSNSERVEGP